MALQVLEQSDAETMERLCELIVPGSRRVGPVLYVDALLAGMPPPVRDWGLGAIRMLASAAEQGAEALAEHARTAEFGFVRALAIEAYYSDFVEPGRNATGAWTEIDFNTPLATRLQKEWSWLGVA